MKKVYSSECKSCPIQEHKLECTTYEFCNKSLLEHDAKVREDAIDFVVRQIIYPLLNEYDIQLWKDIEYIELADKWVEFVKKYKSDDETIINELGKWIAEKLKEQKNDR